MAAHNKSENRLQEEKMNGEGGASRARHVHRDGHVPTGTKITRNRKSLHLLRKFFHALAGVAMAAVYEVLLSREQTLFVFGVLFLLLGAAEGLRILFPNSLFARLAISLLSAIARTYEINHVSGMFFFVAGVLVCVGFYPKNVAVLSILYLSVGDPCASASGISFGHMGMRFSNGKTLIGFLGGVLACCLCTILYFLSSHGLSWQLLGISILGGIGGATTELVCGRKISSDGTVSGGPINIDDNLAVPIFSGLFFYGVLQFFPSFL